MDGKTSFIIILLDELYTLVFENARALPRWIYFRRIDEIIGDYARLCEIIRT